MCCTLSFSFNPYNTSCYRWGSWDLNVGTDLCRSHSLSLTQILDPPQLHPPSPPLSSLHLPSKCPLAPSSPSKWGPRGSCANYNVKSVLVRHSLLGGFPGGASGKEQCRRPKRCGFHPCAGKSPRGGNGTPLQYRGGLARAFGPGIPLVEREGI